MKTLNEKMHPNELPSPTRNGQPMNDEKEYDGDPIDLAAAKFNLSRRETEERFQALDSGSEKNDAFEQIGTLIHKFKHNYKTAVDFYRFFEETLGGGALMAHGSLEQSIANAASERDRLWASWLGKILRELDVYARKQSEKSYVQMSIVTMMFVCGFPDYAGAKSFAEIARRELPLFRRQNPKATVTKCASHFLGQLKLCPMLHQRTEAARQEMKAARLNQLSGNTSEEAAE
jgi:hypothetical protein